MVSGSTIRYADAFSGIDVEYEYRDSKLELNAFLRQKARDALPLPKSVGLNPKHTFLVLVTQYEIPDTVEAYARGQKVSDKGPSGKTRVNHKGKERVEFRNTHGSAKYILPADFAFMATADSSQGKAVRREAKFRHFYSRGDANYVLTGVPYTWLQAQPPGTIVLDPSVSIDASDDVWIEYNSSNNFNGYDHIRIGRGNSFGRKRSLLKFDLSAIPQNAAILSAEMKLYFYGKYGTNVINRVIQCHQVLRDWLEGFATWDYRTLQDMWGTAGVGLDDVDAKAAAEDSLVWGGEYPTWKVYNLAALTQKWVSGTAQNYGVLLWATNEDSVTAGDEKWVHSSEYSDATLRPQLVVTYTVDPLVEITYDAENRPVTVAYGNGVTETNTYDKNRGWLTKREYTREDGTVVYSFDASGTGSPRP